MTTNPAITTIMQSLNEVFAPMDAEVLASSLVWIEERKAALAAYLASDEANEMRRKDYWGFYNRRFAICGGKTWHAVISENGAEGRAAFMRKNCAATAEKRNASIAAKLAKAGVTDVVETTYTRTSDGFDGTFVVQTDAGRKTVTVNTIRAGGYNIQCLHLRVLTRVR